jgi:hypothetical protein
MVEGESAPAVEGIGYAVLGARLHLGGGGAPARLVER